MNFQKIQKMVGVSDFRSSMATYLEKAKSNPVIITANRGDDPFVLLSGEAYNKLVEARELEIDSERFAKLVKQNKGKKRLSWESVKRSRTDI